MSLTPGDLLVLDTDGITEAENAAGQDLRKRSALGMERQALHGRIIWRSSERAESRINSLAYFVKEILTVNDPRTRLGSDASSWRTSRSFAAVANLVLTPLAGESDLNQVRGWTVLLEDDDNDSMERSNLDPGVSYK